MEDIRDQITNTSEQVAPATDTSPIEAPATVPTVNTDADPITDNKSEQVTQENKPDETVQSQTDETPEVKENISKEERKRFGNKVEKKINKLTKAKAEAKAETREAMKRLQEAEAIIEKLKSQEVDIDSMSFDERMKHGIDSGLAEARANEAIQKANKDIQNSGSDVWSAKLEAAANKYEDFTEKIKSSDKQLANHVAAAINESDLSGDLLYKLADNPDLVDELNTVSPMRAAMLLRDVEISITGSNPVLTEQAPAPVVSATPTLNSTIAKPATKVTDMSMEDFMAVRKQIREKNANIY